MNVNLKSLLNRRLHKDILEALPAGVDPELLDFGDLSDSILNDLCFLSDEELDLEGI